MTRRYGEAVKPGVAYRLRPGAYGVLTLGPSVLLTFQSEPEPELQLPGGGIDPGESPLQALHREVFEETGWTIANPRKIGVYRRFTWMPDYRLWAEKVCHIYLARPARRISEPSETHHQAVWSSPRVAAKVLASAGDRSFMARFI